MKRSATVVIGSNYGDEGKGLMTDYYAAQMEAPLVVRFNGGAQAGHTVCTPDGRRHVFNHVGSGSFAGARTYLSRFFVANPLLFFKEQERLAKVDLTPAVYADPRAIVSLPYDMLINQIAESARGTARHGSCGVGFGEAIERSLRPAYTLTMAHLQGSEGAVTDRLRFLLQATRTVWIPERLQTLGIDRNANEATIDLLRVLESEELAEDWISTALRFREQVVLAGPEMVQEAAQRGAVVFEGAQGLLLDQDRGAFPHVTRSNTGIKNVVEIATEAGLEALEITYATRSYLTRHGNGPLPNALPDKPYERAYDNTNKPNTYQGTLRWAHLDLDCLHETIQTDLSDTLGRGLEITTALAVTCADQIDERAIYFHGHQAVYSSKEAFLRDALVSSGLDSLLVSHAPTREGICHYPDAVRL